MLGRRRLLMGAASLAAAAIAPRVAAASRLRTEIRFRIEPSMTLGGASLELPLPPGAELVSLTGDADRIDRTSEGLTALWRGGALAPRLEATIRLPATTAFDAADLRLTTVAGPAPRRSFRLVVARGDLVA